MCMILQIIISNGILDLVTGILAKISLGTGIWAKFRLGTGIWYPPSRPSYRYVPPHRVGFLHCFGMKTGLHFAHFGTSECMNVF